MSHTLALLLIGLVVLCSTPPRVSGRDSRLFSKLTRRVAVVSPSEQGFGLYGTVDDSQADLHDDDQKRYETRYDRDTTTSRRAEPNDQYLYNNNNNQYEGNSEESQKQLGMSDTNGKYYYNVNPHKNVESPERFEFDSMEEYQKYQESRRSTNYDP